MVELEYLIKIEVSSKKEKETTFKVTSNVSGLIEKVAMILGNPGERVSRLDS